MKHYPTLAGDAAKIAGGSFTLADLKSLFNSLSLDIEADKAIDVMDEKKSALLAKLDALIFVWLD